jgi:hypothetical protein
MAAPSALKSAGLENHPPGIRDHKIQTSQRTIAYDRPGGRFCARLNGGKLELVGLGGKA